MSIDRDPPSNSSRSLQLLLFLDERTTSHIPNQEIRSKLADLNAKHSFQLQVVDVGKQPDLAEHYRVIATPALLKLYPQPRQVLAGSNLLDRIDNWWERWQEQLAAGERERSTEWIRIYKSSSAQAITLKRLT